MRFNSRIKDLNDLPKKIIFDGEVDSIIFFNAISYERAMELEKTVGKSLFEKFRKEMNAGNFGIKK